MGAPTDRRRRFPGRAALNRRKVPLIFPHLARVSALRQQQISREVLPRKHTAKLDSVRAIWREMSKVYRATINGRCLPEEATRLVFIPERIPPRARSGSGVGRCQRSLGPARGERRQCADQPSHTPRRPLLAVRSVGCRAAADRADRPVGGGGRAGRTCCGDYADRGDRRDYDCRLPPPC